MDITSSTFTRGLNTAIHVSGVVVKDIDPLKIKGSVTVISSSITDNSSPDKGGAIFLGAGGEANMRDCEVTGNSAINGGPSVFIDNNVDDNALTMLNMVALQPESIGGDRAKGLSCASKGSTVCDDLGVAGGQCVDSSPAGILCALALMLTLAL